MVMVDVWADRFGVGSGKGCGVSGKRQWWIRHGWWLEWKWVRLERIRVGLARARPLVSTETSEGGAGTVMGGAGSFLGGYGNVHGWRWNGQGRCWIGLGWLWERTWAALER